MKKTIREKEFAGISWEDIYDFEIAFLITEARLARGWTQEKLAKAIGTLQPSIARAERGNPIPSHAFLKRIAKVIGAELEPPRFKFSLPTKRKKV